MKKKIAGVAVLFAAVVFLSGCGREQDQQQQQNQDRQPNNQQSEKEAVGSFSGSIADLMKKESALKCEWSMDKPDQKGEGVVYISGRNYRQEIDITQPENVKTHAISDGEFMYSWTDKADTGMKMKIEKTQEEQSNQKQDQQSEMRSVDVNENFDFNCSKWKVDESMFEPPENINFVDYSKQMEQIQNQMRDQLQNQQDQMQNSSQENNGEASSRQIQQDPCSMCEALPAGAKEECLKNCK